MIKLSLPIDGVRSGLLGGSPVSRDYMRGVQARARMLAKATRVKRSRLQKNIPGGQQLADGNTETGQP